MFPVAFLLLFGSPIEKAAQYVDLGDGVTDVHWSFIVDYLRENPGTVEEADSLELAEIGIQKAIKEGELLKPPSASIGESEFSHLLDVVRRDASHAGVAIYDTHGLMIGYGGRVWTSIRLSSDLRREVDASCSLKEGGYVRGPCLVVRSAPCKKVNRLTTKGHRSEVPQCTHGYVSIYRPVIARDRDRNRFVGYSWILRAAPLPTPPY